MTMSGSVYIASSGESWDGISRVIYGDEIHAADLLCANPSLCDLLLFDGGQVIKVPTVESTETDDLTDGKTYEPASAPWKE